MACKILSAIGLYSWIAVVTTPQTPVTLQYKFTAGQVLRYDGSQVINVESTVSGTKQNFTSNTSSRREWKVLEVDGNGNATLAMTIAYIRVEATTPDGKKVAFDTQQKDSQHPFASVVGRPIVQVKLSPSGQVLGIQETESKAAGQFIAHIRTL